MLEGNIQLKFLGNGNKLLLWKFQNVSVKNTATQKHENLCHVKYDLVSAHYYRTNNILTQKLILNEEDCMK